MEDIRASYSCIPDFLGWFAIKHLWTMRKVWAREHWLSIDRARERWENLEWELTNCNSRTHSFLLLNASSFPLLTYQYRTINPALQPVGSKHGRRKKEKSRIVVAHLTAFCMDASNSNGDRLENGDRHVKRYACFRVVYTPRGVSN